MARKNEWQKGLNAKVKSWLSFDSKVGTWTEQIKKDLTSRDLSYENYGDYFFNRGEKYRVDDVVRDGLVCWLDGRDGNNTERTSIWKDRSGCGNDATLHGFDFTNSGWFGNGLKVKDNVNASANTMYCNTDILGYGNRYTVEIVFNITNTSSEECIAALDFPVDNGATGSGVAVFSETLYVFNTTRVLQHQVRNSHMVWRPSGAPVKPVVDAATLYTATCIRDNNRSKLYINGTLAVDIEHADTLYHMNNGWWLTLFTQHSQPTGVTFRNGTIYSAKVYNRALSPDEVLQNYNYEKSIQRG